MNQFLILLSIILLPGIIATIIIGKLTVHSEWSSFKFSLYSLVFGFFSYLILQFICYVIHIVSNCSFSGFNWSDSIIINIALQNQPMVALDEVLLSLGISLPLAFFVSWIVQNKYLNKFAQFLRVTTKYGDENLFSFFLNSKEIFWVYIRDIDNNLTYQGRIESFSESSNMQEIVLSHVKIFRYEDSEELYEIPFIYLSKKAGDFILEAIPKEYIGEENEKKEVSNRR
jgi:hypothetical protein